MKPPAEITRLRAALAEAEQKLGQTQRMANGFLEQKLRAEALANSIDKQREEFHWRAERAEEGKGDMTPEGKVKTQVKDFLKARGVASLTSPVGNPQGFYHMVVPMGKGSPFLGLTICYHGTFGVLETKAEGEEPTVRQALMMRMIQKGAANHVGGYGGTVYRPVDAVVQRRGLGPVSMNFWHDQTSNTLVYDLPEPERVLNHVQGARSLSNGYVAVDPSLYNLQLLRYMGLPVIPPVTLRNYDWPIRAPFRPREHQKIMTNFMVLNPRCFNLSDMGTMKTLASLWAADFVMRENPGWKTLIVCPLSIMQRVWGDAIFNHFIGRRTFVILHGSAQKRRELLKKSADFYIVNHDGVGVGAKITRKGMQLEGLSRDLAERKDIAIVIIDESSAYRAGNTRRHRVARAVLVPKPYVWPLTGTPTANGPLDAHGLARLVNGAHGESFTAYKQRVMYQAGPWKWVPRAGAHAEAYKLLQPSIRFEMRECTDVPPCTEQMRDVELSDEQAKLYKELKRDLVLRLEDGRQITAAHEAALRLKLIQISCGAIYDHEHNVTRIDCSPRLAELRAVIEEAARKVIIFTPLTSVVHLLYEELKEYSRAMINGEVPPKARDEIFRRFQDGT